MEYVTVFERVGIPLGILIFFALGVWRVLKWLGEKVVTPIAESHVSLVESAKKTNEVNAATLEKIGTLLESNESRDKATYALVQETHAIVKETMKK